MRVAVIYTKLADYAVRVMDGFYSSINSAGDRADKITIENYNKFDLSDYDLQIQICKHNPKSPIGKSVVQGIREWCQRSNTRKLCIDTEHILPNHGEFTDKWFSVGFDDIKGFGTYPIQDQNDQRWDSFGLEIAEWKDDGKYILVLGQHEIGVSTCHIDVLEWYRDIIQELNKYDFPVRFRKHPNQKVLPAGNYKLAKDKSLQDDIKSAIFVIGRTTNALNYAIPLGVPVITPDPMAIAYPMASHELDIGKLVRPDREQWCYDLAWTQFSTTEIENGTCWNYLKPYVNSIHNNV
jgi:hypothetical protein